MTMREKHIQEMERLKNEMKTAGAVHRKDLYKRYRRMQQDLQIYDGFMLIEPKRG